MIHLTNVGEIALIASKSFELPLENNGRKLEFASSFLPVFVTDVKAI